MAKDCNNCKFELYNPDEIPCRDCGMDDQEYWKPKPQTNADRIRAMSDEELAEFICKRTSSCSSVSCPGAELCVAEDGIANGLKKWLQQPVEEE